MALRDVLQLCVLGACLGASTTARAEGDAAGFQLPKFQVHGFISEGGFWSTDNDYIGNSSQGSLKLFEAGLTISTEVTDRLRAAMQLYGRDVGDFRDLPPILDFAFLDYRAKPWLGLRAGIIKMPFGLYNEFADIDATRLAILLPQSVYPLRNRSALLAHTGFALYGEVSLRGAGSLEYQAWLGTLNIPENALVLSSNAKLDAIDTEYVTGGQVFWRPPVEGLRLGATYLRASIDFLISLDAATTSALIMLGIVPADYDGRLVISQSPDTLVIGSVEYTRGNWLFAAEYSRTLKKQFSDPPLVPPLDEDNERFYVLATRRLSRCYEVGGYYSVFHVDPDDRRGRDVTKFRLRELGFQRDLALTVRWDVNPSWYWKLEAHFMDGAADLFAPETINPERYWGLFLFKTTVTF